MTPTKSAPRPAAAPGDGARPPLSPPLPTAGGATPERLLARFGLARFRAGQREAVEAALAGRDSLVVMPTGGGKSLCYQLPALADDGLVVVVSPLIALMADQLRRLEQAGVRAQMLASGMADGHNARALAQIESGATQLVLVAPERFASGGFRDALARRAVALFVVDEAHCVAEWGHDFRPDYLRLHDAIASCSGTRAQRPAVMATTATATPRVAQEIAERLGLRDWVSIRSGFDRPNLAFDVVSVEGKGAMARKRAALMHVLGGADARPAIVYCGTRKDSEEVAGAIADAGIATVTYHAGMSPRARRDSQRAFMDGAAEVVVATNAFGMGVDKSDVRTVAHWALPTSLEAYYQEAGRGGRDGARARALLLAARVDLGRLIRFIKDRETSVADVRGYVARLRAGTHDDVALVGHGEMSDRERVLLSIAERAGAVTLAPGAGDGLAVTLTGRGSPRLAQTAISAARNRGWESYRSIERYSGRAQTCRRRQILDHFGDGAPAAPTGRCCDVCDPDAALRAVVEAPVSSVSRRSRGRAPVGAGGGGVGARAHPISSAGAAGAAGARRQLAPDAGSTADASLSAADERDFERLRAWRLARAEGKPAFTVASDATLRAVVRARPGTRDELLGIKGIGPAFSDKHGDSLLELLGHGGDGEPQVS
jgi:ATP-dependent DNA helicase RecQ